MLLTDKSDVFPVYYIMAFSFDFQVTIKKGIILVSKWQEMSQEQTGHFMDQICGLPKVTQNFTI